MSTSLMAKMAILKSYIKHNQLPSQPYQSKAKSNGYTLLELLVVVAIMATMAMIAKVAVHDTNARTAAAAHVSIMDELQKGISGYKALHTAFPNRFDSLISIADANYSNAKIIDIAALDNNVGMVISGLRDIFGAEQMYGLSQLMYVRGDQKDDSGPSKAENNDGTLCLDANLTAIVSSRDNSFVAGNIFNQDAGCGVPVTLAHASADGAVKETPVAVWTGGNQRISHQQTGSITAINGILGTSNTSAAVYLAVGMGPSATLFDAEKLGGMTSVPVYKHVSAEQYNRFIGLFNIGEVANDGTFTPATHIKFAGVVDGAGDTKEEELGEWDGTRNTI